MKKKGSKKTSHKNNAALVILFVLLCASFIFPIYNYTFLSKTWSDKNMTFSAITFELFSGKYTFETTYETIFIFMIITFLVMIVLYLYDGIKNNNYAKYASYLSFLVCILGLAAMNEINKNINLPFFGNNLGSVSLGFGLIIIPMCGLIYLLFNKPLHKILTF